MDSSPRIRKRDVQRDIPDIDWVCHKGSPGVYLSISIFFEQVAPFSSSL